MKQQSGSAHIIGIVAVIVVLLGALGYVFWQNFAHSAHRNNGSTGTIVGDPRKQPERMPAEGAITGMLTYPSEGLPPTMTAHAINLSTHQIYSTDTHLADSQYATKFGYRLVVPAGEYYVFGTKGLDLTNGSDYAFYDEFMKCGMAATCKDTTKIKVSVEAHKDTPDITVGNWWKLCAYTKSAATTDWLLMPVCYKS